MAEVQLVESGTVDNWEARLRAAPATSPANAAPVEEVPLTDLENVKQRNPEPRRLVGRFTLVGHHGFGRKSAGVAAAKIPSISFCSRPRTSSVLGGVLTARNFGAVILFSSRSIRRKSEPKNPGGYRRLSFREQELYIQVAEPRFSMGHWGTRS